MRKVRPAVTVVMPVFWAALHPPPAPAQQVAEPVRRIRQQVEAISVAEAIAGRRDAIVGRLRALGLEPELVWFDPPAQSRVERRGANILATIPGGPGETILLGAHYDRVERGRGVIDNGAGVAAVLDLAERLRRRPLENHTVRIAFFDLEEHGLLGSRALVGDSANRRLPGMFLNFDIFGYGDAFWIGAEDASAALPQALLTAGRAAGLGVVIDSMYPSSDHLSFRSTSTRSFAITLLDRGDIETLLARLRMRVSTGEVRVFSIMHTDADTIDKLDPSAVARGVDAVERALRELDAAAAGAEPKHLPGGDP